MDDDDDDAMMIDVEISTSSIEQGESIEGIIRDDLGEIHLASIDALIVHFTDKSSNPSDIRAFLLTYSLVIQPEELFEKLLARFDSSPPPLLESHPALFWRKVVRLRVVNLLMTWFRTAPCDFFARPALSAAVYEFVEHSVIPGLQMPSSFLQRFKSLSTDPHLVELPLNASYPHPASSALPVPLSRLQDIDPHEVARQLTLLESAIFGRICHRELLDLAWFRHQERAPNIMALIHHNALLSCWIDREMRTVAHGASRRKLAWYFLRLLDHLLSIQSFSTAFPIFKSLHQHLPPVSQLYSSDQTLVSHLSEIYSSQSNWAKMRALIRDSSPPLIPYIGMYLTDLTFIQETSTDAPPFISPPSNSHPLLLKFRKLKIVASVIIEVQQLTLLSHNFLPIPQLQDFLKSCFI